VSCSSSQHRTNTDCALGREQNNHRSIHPVQTTWVQDAEPSCPLASFDRVAPMTSSLPRLSFFQAYPARATVKTLNLEPWTLDLGTPPQKHVSRRKAASSRRLPHAAGRDGLAWVGLEAAALPPHFTFFFRFSCVTLAILHSRCAGCSSPQSATVRLVKGYSVRAPPNSAATHPPPSSWFQFPWG
jgi:hypothetical protein